MKTASSRKGFRIDAASKSPEPSFGTMNRASFATMVCTLFCLSLFSPSAAVGIELSRNGHTDYTIVRADNPIPSETRAAEELSQYLKEMTGATFPIVCETQAGKGPRIYLTSRPKTLGQEEFIIRTVGRNLYIVGGRPRGVLYGVYYLLDNILGVRWWAPGATFVPERCTLRLQSLSIRKKPFFEYRDVFYFGAMDADWAARNRCNGRVRDKAGKIGAVDDHYGGGVVYDPYYVHSFACYVPSSTYFDSHPEWFSEIDGKRVGGYNQICLSNPRVLDLVVEKVRTLLKADPAINVVTVSQNDNGIGYCRCAQCRKIDDEEGSPSGSLLRFVNSVAEGLEPEFPNVSIDTLAYQYSRRPPKHIRPRRNVVIRYCTIEASFAQPLTDPVNSKLADDLHSWSLITNRIYVWDYVTNLTNYFRPHPNLYVLGPNIKFYAKNNVKGIFAQAVHDSPVSEFSELRAWVLSRLMWDPSLDDRALIREFAQGYYGPAAPHILGYIDKISRISNISSYALGWVGGVKDPWASPEHMIEFDALFQKALTATRNQPEIQKRVRRAYLPIQYMWLTNYDAWSDQAGAKHRTLPHSFDSVFADFERQTRQDKFENAGWGKTSDFLAMVKNRSVRASGQAFTWPTLAYDGNSDTSWNAGDFAPQWIQRDLGKEASVNAIHTDFSSMYTNIIYHIETSMDGVSWTTVVPDKTVTDGKGEDAFPQPADARFVKTTILKAETNDSPQWAGIVEQRIECAP